MSFLELKNISMSYGEKEILQDLSFSLKKNEFVSIVGPSGSGKSTIFSLIGGSTVPVRGKILLEEEEVTGKRGRISYMPQSASLLPWRNLLDNVTLGQELSGTVDKGRALEMLEQAGLGEYQKAFPHELSGGMKQRAAFVRALLSPQSLLCLDEPFSALDELRRTEMHEWLLGLLESHPRTVLFVTHNIDEALFLSDRILVLKEKPATIVADYKVPFQKPRSESLILSDQFLQSKREIFDFLKGKRE
ncbi:MULTISPECIES: ABC transporter ATP-binding protein [unclassified Bacillus (in: firmicutes)]|uniref:ABC transporter ATP-binding protein n=1 Tax=unclassified Bacillus (in: firmicutes) TaxID=185979 RepID=UPI0008F34441|nr:MULTISPECIES: ABC transporter ATP-binding protein [unclassified Bacillus (in: firmicutes)]SFA70492.1 ABC-type nitrate/sulfonate/bicarbonate transport system, ATPase component [Bacillus sp. UNCCL13]SFQ60327.1 ABC-type nitrate/sulfonate/bicarbonate transport system, ATPase component [Bacillus sp. cl95]